MSYQVIARRFRPQVFADVVGQEHATRVLEGAITTERVAHAYLFCGPRGVGKTSTARILARALNCAAHDGPTPEPCNACDVCQSITIGNHMDTIEIDGASNRGIDDVRELRESAKYAPVGGRYKLYIIDEVHMLTNEAFNALLKTLEEPPHHVVFVFATTEAQKVPGTIVSRCQRLDFRRLGVADIAKQLEAIVAHEKYKIEPAAVTVLARRGQGSMRDAESLLEQVMVASNKRQKLTREAVERLLGLTPSEAFLELTNALAAGDAAAALQLLERTLDDGHHLEELTTGLIEHLRGLMLLKVSPELAPRSGLDDEMIAALEDALGRLSIGDLTRMLEIAALCAQQMRRSDFPGLHLEVALVEMAELPRTADLSELVAALEGGGEKDPSTDPPPKRRAAKRGSRAAEPTSAAPSGAAPGDGVEAYQAAAPLAPAAPTEAAAPAAPTEAAAPPPGPTEATAPAAPTEAAAPPPGPTEATAPAAPTAAAARSGADAHWQRFLGRVKHRKAYLASMLADLADHAIVDDTLVMTFAPSMIFQRQQVNSAANRQILTEELYAEFGRQLKLKITGGEAPPAAQAPARRRVPLEYTGEVEQLIDRVGGVILPDSP